jgi:hypothetical protein
VQRPHEAVANKEEPMTGSLTTVIRRTGLLLIVMLGALAAVGSAHGDTGQGVPPQSAIDAASARWAAKAKVLDANGRPQFDQLPPLSAIDADSARWAAKAKVLDANGRPQFDQLPPLSAIDAASATWAAKAKVLDVNGRPVSGVTVSPASVTVSPASGGDGFDWGDFGIGAAAMLGLVLLGGIAAAVHYSRRAGVRPRTVS